MPRMANRWRERAVWMIVAAACAVGGYATGNRQMHGWAIGMMQREASGQLTQRIEALSQLRLGDTNGAAAQLDAEVDTLIVGMSRNAGADRQALASAKTYFSVVPPSPDRADVLSPLLADVPVLAPGQCTNALSALLRAQR
jgi:hypothetical protein